ncbi:uncharacterized protein LOC110414152 [Herrania umbratica]|uniref:Uncharacterized protein LOC110414152 n=1 Tax=Herrania umbratica TaxID=108875 RepID=A0A6J1A179_9ROSI|nr:uncharacterized protein LOC110414152 [Herrania umbratica]
MELNNKKLQTLIERAWALHDRLNDEIENSISFCRFCSDHGRYCDVGQTPFEERERLIAIRDSLKEVENTLLHLQKLQSWRLVDRHSALTSLEQSRLFLIKQVTQYQGRPLDVVRELNACFGNDDRAAFDRNVEELTVKKNGVQSRSRRRLSSFLICCIRFLFNPWKWQSAVGIAIKLILISASLSTTIQFYHAKHQSCNSQKKIVSTIMYSKEAENIDSLLTISKSPLDVFCGRG